MGPHKIFEPIVSQTLNPALQMDGQTGNICWHYPPMQAVAVLGRGWGAQPPGQFCSMPPEFRDHR